ncbi:MAG: hypothetical protein AAB514_00575 [Patescibacteria group bacterium]
MSSFQNFIQENKRNILIAFLSFLIVSLSFGLGYLLARETNQTPIIIEKCADFVSEP